MADALARLVEWQRGGEGRSAALTLDEDGNPECELMWGGPGDASEILYRFAPTPDAAITAALAAFEEQKGRGT